MGGKRYVRSFREERGDGKRESEGDLGWRRVRGPARSPSELAAR